MDIQDSPDEVCARCNHPKSHHLTQYPIASGKRGTFCLDGEKFEAKQVARLIPEAKPIAYTSEFFKQRDRFRDKVNFNFEGIFYLIKKETEYMPWDGFSLPVTDPFDARLFSKREEADQYLQERHKINDIWHGFEVAEHEFINTPSDISDVHIPSKKETSIGTAPIVEESQEEFKEKIEFIKGAFQCYVGFKGTSGLEKFLSESKFQITRKP